MQILIGFSLVLSIVALWYSRKERGVIVNTVAWRGKVIHSALRLETDGASVLISDDLKPFHDQEMIVIAFPLISGKGGE